MSKDKSSYNPEPEIDDEEARRKAWEKKRNCKVEGCPMPGTVSDSTICDDSTLFNCSYHDLFPGSDVAPVITDVLNQYVRLLKIQKAAMELNPHEYETRVRRSEHRVE